MGKGKRIGAVLVLAAILLLGSEFDPEAEFRRILKWEKPAKYPPPMLEGMDLNTLAQLVEAGNLQWYEPRPTPDQWEAMVGMKIHASPELVWQVITDYPALCKIMPATYLACATEWRKGNQVKNNQKGQTTIIKFAYKYDIIDIVTENPPYNLHVQTIEGLNDRELTMLIIPWDNNQSTVFFMRYYLNMGALGYTMQAMLKVLPTMEPPTAVGADNYHARAYKNEAEQRAGYKAAPEPGRLKVEGLDLATLHKIQDHGGGLLRETPAGEIIDVLAFTFIQSPPSTVWEVITDFEHFATTFPGAAMNVESRDGNTVTVLQKTQGMSILIFDFGGFELHARYTLDPPDHISYRAFDGLYEGSQGEYRILPIENGTQTLLFLQGGYNMEKDKSLTARIFQSGAFPLKNMLFMLGSQTTLAHVKEEAEKRQAVK